MTMFIVLHIMLPVLVILLMSMYPGVILSYELWMRGGLERDGEHNLVETRIFHTTGQHDPLQLGTTILPPPHTDYIMSGLQPFTVYQFQVLAQNEVGRAVSHPWVSAFTMEAGEGTDWCRNGDISGF